MAYGKRAEAAGFRGTRRGAEMRASEDDAGRIPATAVTTKGS